MSYEIVTTHFVAHERDLEEAYALYRQRIETSGAVISAVSPRPHPIEDEFTLWDLRCQAAYDNLPAPDQMRLYELNALVDFATTNRDNAIEKFFFEDHDAPTHLPASLGGLMDLTLRDEPQGPLSLTTIVYLGSPEHMLLAQKLFDDTVADLNAVAYQPYVAPLEGTEHAGLVGPLWLRDATLNIIGKGDGHFSPGKDAWAGWLLTSDGPEDVDRQLHERIDTDAVVITRAVQEPF